MSGNNSHAQFVASRRKRFQPLYKQLLDLEMLKRDKVNPVHEFILKRRKENQ